MRRMVILLLGMFGLYTASFAQETGRWPISNSSANTADVLTSAYGPRDLGNDSYDIHEGVDIRAQTPLPVYPWKSGEVEDKGITSKGALYVKIRHDKAGNSDPWRTGYYHLTNKRRMSNRIARYRFNRLTQKGESKCRRKSMDCWL